MANGIGQEASTLAMLTSDVDLYRYTYRDYEEQLDGSKINVSFVSPIFCIFERHRFFLLQNSEKLQLKSEWKYRPDYISYEKYGTTVWWQLILWINDIKSIEYFDAEYIIVPTPQAISTIQQEAYTAGGAYIDINEDDKHTVTKFTLYRPPINSLNKVIGQINSSSGSTSSDDTQEDNNIKFNREIFTMDIPILRLKYVDLSNVPIENSIKVRAKCRPNLIYGKHYILTEGKNKVKNRITWDPKIIENSGLLFKLKENDIMEIQYVSNE